MSLRYVSVAASLAIVALAAGLIVGPTLMPKYMTSTATVTSTSTYFSTITELLTKYVTLTETTTATEYLTKTELKLITLTREVTRTLTTTATKVKLLTTTHTVTKLLTTTSVTTKTITTTTTVGTLSVTRSFDIFLLDNSTWVRVTVEIPLTYVKEYLGKRVVLYVGKESQQLSSLVAEGAKMPPIYNLAMKLWLLAKKNPEVYASYVLQVIHQMNYNFSKAHVQYGGVQPPITTLIENSGVCIDYAVLFASMMKVANVSSAIVYAKVWSSRYGIEGEPHAMVAVKLPTQPQLPQKYHTYFIERGLPASASVNVEGKIYYLADPTPSYFMYVTEPGGKPEPPTMYYPAFVGEHSWDKVVIEDVYKVS